LAEARLVRLRGRIRNEGNGLAVGTRGDQGWLGGLTADWAEVVASTNAVAVRIGTARANAAQLNAILHR